MIELWTSDTLMHIYHSFQMNGFIILCTFCICTEENIIGGFVATAAEDGAKDQVS